MNPTGEWKEYAQLVMTTIERLENEIQNLKNRQDADKMEFIQKLEQIRSDLLSEIERLRTENRDKEIDVLRSQLEAALATVEAQKVAAEESEAAKRDEIIRDHKVDSFFATRAKLFWALLVGGVGTLWAVVEFIIEPLIKGAGGG